MPFAPVTHAVDIHYELHGRGPGVPALLIVGLGADGHGWERVLPRLAASRPVLVLDNRGAGRSSKPPGPYSAASLADDVVAVMDHAGVARAHVAGMSLGGMIAQELALRHSARVRSLALIATWASAPADVRGDILTSVDAALADPRTALGRLTMLLLANVYSPRFFVEEADYLRGFFARSASYGRSLDGLTGQIRAALDHDASERLGRIDAPTVAVAGTDDRVIPVDCARGLAAGISGARLVEIPGAGHGLALEAPGPLADVLHDWFSEHD